MAERMTIDELKSYLWQSAVLLRTNIDAGAYKQYIFPLLFFKRICDVYDEETEKDYSKFIEIGKAAAVQKPHEPFTQAEIDTLWASVGKVPFVDTVLILIYTGMRAGELLDMRKENVHLEERYMVGGSKTEAGKNRIIPLNDKIIPLVQTRYNTSDEYLIEPHLSYTDYNHRFNRAMSDLHMAHRTHDGRHTFASLMDTANANPKALKTIMGHAGGDLTSKVYIHKSLPELLDNVNRI